jgi:hypothetical protein
MPAYASASSIFATKEAISVRRAVKVRLALEDQGTHFVPAKLEGIRASEDVPELEIQVQPLVEVG